jgi:hypothetical protein
MSEPEIVHDAEVVQERFSPLARLRALTSILLDRFQFMRQAGLTFGGARDMYDILGYDRIVTAKQYRDEYARGGIAKRIVECYPKATWRGGVEIYEDEENETDTGFEKAWKDLETRLSIWSVLQRADILAGLSTYSVILLGAPGNLDEEMPKGSPDQMAFVTPFAGGGGPGPNQGTQAQASNYVDATIRDFDTDPTSRRFGLPLFYQLRRLDVTSPALQRPVHWSRIIHVAEGVLDNEVYGQPTLENVWNLLADLEKVTGGGAEAFWLRANQGMNLNLDKDVAMDPDDQAKLKDEVGEYQHNISRVLKTRGMEVKMLGSDTANFVGPVDAILKQIAGSKGIPMRILTGSEMGQLASGQDADNWNTAVMDRRTSYAGPCIVRRLVDRLVEYAYLPTPAQYEVNWPVEENLTETEKAALALSLANVNKVYGATVFDDDFIRDKCYKLEPLPEAAPYENLSEIDKATLAKDMALVNKEQGLTVFTPAEIREHCFGFDPLPPDEEVPIGAPERISVGQPPPEPGTPGAEGIAVHPASKGAAPNLNTPQMKAALAALEAAIEDDDADAVARIVGLTT